MSDEEKAVLKTAKENYGLTSAETKILVNLIEKQQKEIEELKEKNEFLNWYFENQKENFVHKDKIKAKIEEYKKQQKEEPDSYLCIKVLQSLLEKE